MLMTAAECFEKFGGPALVAKAVRDGHVRRICHGIYSDGARHRDIEVLQFRYSNSVATMLSAYYYYDLTDHVPDKCHLAVERGSSKINDPKAVGYFVPKGTGDIGVVKETMKGVPLRIYDSVRRFVSRLNHAAPCKIGIKGSIITLKQQEYKGKRIFLKLTDDEKKIIETKMDIGVHTREDVRQGDFGFRSVTDGETVTLLVNSKEQIFVEKLKSLLKFGGASTRFKDIYDMCYLSARMKAEVLAGYIDLYVFKDAKMREKDVGSVCRRLERVFGDKDYVRALEDPMYAWLDVSPKAATKAVIDCIASLNESAYR